MASSLSIWPLSGEDTFAAWIDLDKSGLANDAIF